jgi:predicted Zn-dependent protease
MRTALLIPRRFRAALLLALLPPLTSCAINPVTGERELSLVSEGQEIQMGRDADGQISRSLGLFPDSAWQRYVASVGAPMTAVSERPALPWTIRVLNDPIINAFALPGGYVYVTRGILAYLTSEAELAGVLGHEIGHVTARHGAQQATRQQIAQIGLGVGTILAPPELRGVAQAAGAGVGLLFLRYGRDAERQADELGLRYMTAQGYDPREMAETFQMLYNSSGGDEAERIPNWLSTHPDPLARRDRILAAIDSGRVRGDRIERDAYLSRLQGMVFGENPREGYFRENLFHHPDLQFRLSFPAGWQTANGQAAVQGMSPQEDAMIELTLAEGATAREAANAFLAQEGLLRGPVQNATLGGLTAVLVDFRAATESGELTGTGAFIEHGGRVFRVLGYAVASAWNQRQDAVRAAVESFRRETDQAVLRVQPQRIELVRTEAPMTLQAFHQRYPSAVPIEVIGTINRVERDATIPARTLMKRVVGEPLP